MSDEPQTPASPENESEYDLNQSVPIHHDFGKIVGNQLQCVIHDPNTSCPVIFVKPTMVLIEGADGSKHLYDTELDRR